MNQEAQDYYNALRNNRTINPYVFDLLFEAINGNVTAKPHMSMQLFNGLPLVFDAQLEARLLGQLYPGGLNLPSENNTVTQTIVSSSITANSNIYALNSPLAKQSIFYTELDGDFFSGNVPMLPILYKIGAPMPEVYSDKSIVANELNEVLIKANTKASETTFNYKKFINESEIATKYWDYNKTTYVGQVILNKKLGEIDPQKIIFEKDGIFYNLYIPFKNDSNVSLNNPNIEYLKANAIIKIMQLDQDAFAIILSNLSNSKRKDYILKIYTTIIAEIEKLFDNKNAFENLLAIPIALLRLFNIKTVEKIFYGTLNTPIIPFYRETILIDCLEVLSEKKDFNATLFLTQLLKSHRQANTVFERLYNVMNDWGGENNFSRIILLVAKIWAISEYANPNNKIYKNFSPTTPLAYQQKYILGFRNDDFNFEFKNEELLIEQLDLPVPIPGTIRFQKHHIFQPIEIVNVVEVKNEELLIANDVPIPTFYLKAFDDKGAWENFEKSLWLVFDVVTLFTGVGNLAKLRRLAQTEKITYIAIKTTFGVVQVASSTISIGLALIQNSKNSEVVNTVREYLFWAEVCTLSLDVISSKILSLKAGNARITLVEYRKTVKDVDELKEIDEFLEHLDEVASQNAKRIFDNVGNSKIEYEMLSSNLLRKYITDIVEKCSKKGVKLSINWIDETHPLYRSNTLGRFGNPITFVDKNFAQLELRQPCPKITFDHEEFHIDDFLEMGWQKYRKIQLDSPWLHEEAVWNRIFKNRNKYQEAELMDSYAYYKDFMTEMGQKPKIIKELEALLPKYGVLNK